MSDSEMRDALASWPEVIFLQHGDDDLVTTYPGRDEVTWCDHRIFDSDVRYVRADATPALLDHVDTQAAEIAWLRNSAWTNGDVLKQTNAEATKLRADNAHLRATLSQSLMALEGYLPNHRNDVIDRAISAGRAALSGESK